MTELVVLNERDFESQTYPPQTNTKSLNDATPLRGIVAAAHGNHVSEINEPSNFLLGSPREIMG